MTMVGDILEPDLLNKLRKLESFRDYEARVKATADADARAAAEAAAEARVAAAVLEATLRSKADDLTGFFHARGDKPTAHAFSRISACRDVSQLAEWLSRAYAGETAAEIFPES